MSEETKNEEKTPNTSQEDVKNIRRYFEYFKVDVPKDLAVALDSMEASLTYKTEQDVKFALAKCIVDDKQKKFDDKLFDVTKEISTKYLYDEQFDRDVQEEFTVDPAATEASK